MTPRRLIPAAALALTCAAPALAVVSSDLHWVRERSPIRVHSPLVIDSMGSLTIDPGVEVQFRPGAGLVIQGRLLAQGTSSAPIRFVPMLAGDAWQGVSVQGGDAVMEGVELRGAGIDASGGATILAASLVQDAETAVRARSGARVLVAASRLRRCAIGVEAEDGSVTTLRGSEIAHAAGTGLLVQAGATVTIETCAFHDDGLAVDVAQAEGVALGRLEAGVLRGGSCVFSCNALDVVNRSGDELPARGNLWTSSSRREGPVDVSEPATSVPAALDAYDRLFVGKAGDAPAFGWESLGDCAGHDVSSSTAPDGTFGPAGDDDAPLVFYRMATRWD